MHIVKLGQADAGDNEAKLMTKLAPEWVMQLMTNSGINRQMMANMMLNKMK